MKSVLLPLLAVLSSLIALGCGSVPSQLSNLESGHFKSKALVRDLKTNKSQVVNLEVKAFDMNNVRLDVTSSLGMHVFSLVNTTDKVEYMIVPEKKHFSGKSGPKALAPVFSAPIDPRYLGYMFFEKPVPDKNWSCENDAENKLATCKDLKSKMTITWEKNKDGSRLIRILYPNVSLVQINVKDFSNDLKNRDETLQLKVPKSFSSQQI